MCLFSKRKTAKRAKEDIVCWKVLVYKDKGVYRKGFYAPYQGTFVSEEIEEGFVQKPAEEKFLVTDANLFLVGKRDDRPYRVNGGAVHTYKTFGDAFWICNLEYNEGNHLMEDEVDHCHLFRCIIPKGTKYYEDENCYASEKIIFLEEVNTVKQVLKYIGYPGSSTWHMPYFPFDKLDEESYEAVMDVFRGCAVSKKDLEVGASYEGFCFERDGFFKVTAVYKENKKFYFGPFHDEKGFIPYLGERKEMFFVPFKEIEPSEVFNV